MHERSPTMRDCGIQPAGGVGSQLIIFSDEERNAIGTVLGQCKEASYDYVEATLNLLSVPAAEVLRAQDEHCISVQTVHVGYPDIETDEGLDSILGFLKAIGTPFLMCSGRSAESSDPQYGLDRSSNRFISVARQCAERDITFYYHFFDWAFQPFGGVDFLGELLSRTEGEPVEFCLDVMWAQYGQMDPSTAVKKLGSRCNYYHFKDAVNVKPFSRPTFVPLGKGEVHLDSCLNALAASSNPVYVVVEQDRSTTSALQDLAESRAFLQQRGI